MQWKEEEQKSNLGNVKDFPSPVSPCSYSLFLRLVLGEIFWSTMQWTPIWMLLQFIVKRPVEMWAFWTVSDILLFHQTSLSPHRHKNNVVSVLQSLCSYITSWRRCDWDISILRVVTSLRERVGNRLLKVMNSSVPSPWHKNTKWCILEKCWLKVFLVCKWINIITATKLPSCSIFYVAFCFPSAALCFARLEIQESQLQFMLQLRRAEHL